MENNIAPLGFELSRELTMEELQEVGGGKGTAGGGVTVSSGRPDGEVHIDADW